MDNLSAILQVLKLHKRELTAKYKLKSIGVFGSFSRGEQQAKSDVDILIDYEQPMGVEFIDLADELEQLLLRKVDLVSKNAIKKSVLPTIEKDLVYV